MIIHMDTRPLRIVTFLREVHEVKTAGSYNK